MKTAIYVEDGTVQLVITPESDFEKNAIQTFGDGPVQAQMFRGTFYDCRGGWVRQSEYNSHLYDLSADKGDRSLILRMDFSSKPGDGPGVTTTCGANGSYGATT
ncbi:MAG: hypothetical protein ACOYMV_13105 [Verrucomicrobiia bacterium]